MGSDYAIMRGRSRKAFMEERNMNLAFCGLKHAHIKALYALCAENPDVRVVGAWDDD